MGSAAAATGCLGVGVTASAAEDGQGLPYRTATEMVKALEKRSVSARELVEAAITRIETLDAKINAVVVRDFDRARRVADMADAALAKGERRPLLGLPMTVKEQFNVAGLPTTWGHSKYKAWKPAEDALVVQRLKRAGAIILGKTNIPTDLADWQSFSPVYGTTNNPWDLARTPGGSSGGSAAALAAGYVPLEFGSDIFGSLRCPAHFCGVFSHKPSLDLVPLRGSGPPETPAVPVRADLAVIGPLARSAADLALLLGVTAGPDEAMEGIGYRLVLPPPRQAKLTDFRVLVIDSHPLCPIAANVGAALDGLADRLGRLGCKILRTSPRLPDLAPDHADLCRAAVRVLRGQPARQGARGGRKRSPIAVARRSELCRSALARSRDQPSRLGPYRFYPQRVAGALAGAVRGCRYRHLPADADAGLPARPLPATSPSIGYRRQGRALRRPRRVGRHRHAQRLAGDDDADRAQWQSTDRRADHRRLSRRQHDARLCRHDRTRIRRLHPAARPLRSAVNTALFEDVLLLIDNVYRLVQAGGEVSG
jgi:amidase